MKIELVKYTGSYYDDGTPEIGNRVEVEVEDGGENPEYYSFLEQGYKDISE
jgi:hypothetical protein